MRIVGRKTFLPLGTNGGIMHAEKKNQDRKNQEEAEAPNPFADAEVLFAYTRAQAIADGVLVDVSTTAK
jgi:hypothetical protein